jgi:hypothetical protein
MWTDKTENVTDLQVKARKMSDEELHQGILESAAKLGYVVTKAGA